jgi:hypothetical protein
MAAAVVIAVRVAKVVAAAAVDGTEAHVVKAAVAATAGRVAKVAAAAIVPRGTIRSSRRSDRRTAACSRQFREHAAFLPCRKKINLLS